MFDSELRELERALQASPGDRALAQRFLQALRRAGHIAEPSSGLEVAPNPGLATDDLALVIRPSRPRAAFEWLPEMDALVGEVASVVRLERDGLGAVLAVPRVRPERWPGDPFVGRSFGFASLRPIRLA